MCFHAISEPCKHIPRSYQDCQWGKRLWGVCLRELGAMWCYYIMWHFTGNGPPDRSGERTACFRNYMGWTKSVAVRNKKTDIGWIFRQLVCQTVLLPTERKEWILVHTQDVSPQDQKFSRYTWAHWTSLTEKTWWNRHLDACFPFLWLGGLPYRHTLRGNCDWKMNSKQMFSSIVCSFNEGKAPTESVFYYSRNCSASKNVRAQACSEDLISRVRAVCLAALSKTSKCIPGSYHVCP